MKNELSVENTSFFKSVQVNNGTLTVDGFNIVDGIINLQTAVTDLQNNSGGGGDDGPGGGFVIWNPIPGSDDRLKHNEKPVINALDTINKLQLLEYDKTRELKEEDFKGELEEGTFIKESGFIAQEVEKIPELKHLVYVGDEKTPYRLNYTGISCYLVQAVQELSAKVNKLEAELLKKN